VRRKERPRLLQRKETNNAAEAGSYVTWNWSTAGRTAGAGTSRIFGRVRHQQTLTLKGTLAKWEMINPHSWFHIDVTGPDGKVTEWMIEGGSPNALIRLGVTKNTVKIGTELTIEAYQAKEGTNKAVGRNFTLPDGSRLFLGCAPGATCREVKRNTFVAISPSAESRRVTEK
jgi:hypothetical protein